MSADFTAVIANGLASIKATATAAAGGLKNLATGVTKTGEEASKAEKKMRDLGAAVARMGGPAGEIGGKLFGAMGMSGGLSRLAAAAAIAGIAFKAFGAVMDATKARAEAFAAAAAGLRAAAKGAAEAGRNMAAGAAGIGRTAAKAENVFGPDASARAGVLANAYGVGTEDVLQAMGGLGGVKADMRARVLEAAMTAAGTGEMTAAEAVGMITSDPTMLRRVTSRQAGGGLSAAQQGAADLIQARRGSRGPEGRREALDTVGSSGAARDQLKDLNRAENILANKQVQRFTTGETVAATRGESARAADPLSAALVDWTKAEQERQQAMRDEAKMLAEQAKIREDMMLRTDKLFGAVVARVQLFLKEQEIRRAEIAAGRAVGTTGTSN